MLTSIKGGLPYPHDFGNIQSTLAGSGNTTLDAAGEKACVVFKAPKTGNIDRVGFFTRAVTAAETLRIGLETTDSSYLPTGTQYGGSAVGTQAAPSANTFYEVTLATPAAATAGDLIAAVVQFDSAIGNLQIGNWDCFGGTEYEGFPFIARYTGGAWSKLGSVPGLTIRYDDGTYEFIGTIPFGPRIDTFFHSGSTPDEMGNIVRLPVQMRAWGVQLVIGSANNFDVVLYNGDGSTVLRTLSFAGAQMPGTNGRCLWVPFSSPVTLDANTDYRLTFKPTVATNLNIREVEVITAAMLNMLPGGSDVHKTSRTDGGAWTQNTLRRVWGLALVIDQIHDGAGGGSISISVNNSLVVAPHGVVSY